MTSKPVTVASETGFKRVITKPAHRFYLKMLSKVREVVEDLF